MGNPLSEKHTPAKISLYGRLFRSLSLSLSLTDPSIRSAALQRAGCVSLAAALFLHRCAEGDEEGGKRACLLNSLGACVLILACTLAFANFHRAGAAAAASCRSSSFYSPAPVSVFRSSPSLSLSLALVPDSRALFHRPFASAFFPQFYSYPPFVRAHALALFFFSFSSSCVLLYYIWIYMCATPAAYTGKLLRVAECRESTGGSLLLFFFSRFHLFAVLGSVYKLRIYSDL